MFRIFCNILKKLYKNIDKKCLIIIGIVYFSVFIWFYNKGFYNIYISWKKLGII